MPKETATEGKLVFDDPVLIPLDKIRPNPWNPNYMTPDIFNELVDNMSGEAGFAQPIMVMPIPEEERTGDGYEYMIVDGEHRFDSMKLFDVDSVPCYIRSMTTDQAKFQTVKMNRLKGKFNQKKFNNLVVDLMDRYSLEEVAEKMAFTDPTELEGMIDQARDTLPTEEMKEEFDRAKSEIRTVDDLSGVLNRLFTQFGDTLPANFMIMDFGGKEHIWVRLKPAEYRSIVHQAREAMAAGVTFDSVLARLITEIDITRFIRAKRDFLEEISEENISRGVVQIDDES